MDKLAAFRYVYLDVVGRDISPEEIMSKLEYLEKIKAYDVAFYSQYSMSVQWNVVWAGASLWGKSWEDKVSKIGYSCDYVLDIRFLRVPILWLDLGQANRFADFGYKSVNLSKMMFFFMDDKTHMSKEMELLLADYLTIGAKVVIGVAGMFGFLLLPTQLVIENCGVFSGKWGFLGL